ncbi:MAG: DegT/DnrJ/EryC1/StrS family aminotransferase, partial [Gammaproteobacteria bacterium]
TQLQELHCDYMLINGLFTVKHSLSDQEMWDFMTNIIISVWPFIRKGLAFNVMSKQVDWEREDLFHVSLDQIADFMHRLAGRNINFRADYGLHEFTVYAYKTSNDNTYINTEEKVANQYISVCLPQLPQTAQLIPYLQQIDQVRWYSNHGILVKQFESRLAHHFKLEQNSVLSTSSGSSALIGAILATAGLAQTQQPLALCPSYTYIATVSALCLCGYQPYFVDVDSDQWQLQAQSLLDHPQLQKVGIVVPVGIYGRPVLQKDWLTFQQRTGIPVVIDMAAGFDSLSVYRNQTLGPIATIISLHATKVFSSAEGGVVLTTNTTIREKCRHIINAGYASDRRIVELGFNARMSEYHAAIGLAELDGWSQKRQAYIAVAERYHIMAMKYKIEANMIIANDYASSYVLFLTHTDEQATLIVQALHRHHIDSRFWYGSGIHREPIFQERTRDKLPITEALAPRLIGLPCYVDLSRPQIDNIVKTIAQTLIT